MKNKIIKNKNGIEEFEIIDTSYKIPMNIFLSRFPEIKGKLEDINYDEKDNSIYLFTLKNKK